MAQALEKQRILNQLQTDILRLQGFKPSASLGIDFQLGPIVKALPGKCFPLGAVHEFLAHSSKDVAATNGFVAGLLSTLLRREGAAVWISSSRTLYPPALYQFGIKPERFIFVDLKNEKEVAWALDEALKCGALSAVVGEVSDISFMASRRLQLAVEESQVTGFVIRNSRKPPSTTASVSRWKITSQPSTFPKEELPGVGFPTWQVELQRIRNGKPGAWTVQWINGQFASVEPITMLANDSKQNRKVG